MPNTDWEAVGRKSAKVGNSVQVKALPLLEKHFAMVERIESGFKVFRIKGRMIATPATKVSGDFRAIVPHTVGRSVLIECKWRKGDRLLWSAVEKHQWEALDLHRSLGGVSLLLWVSDIGFYLFEPHAHPEFKRGSAIKSSDVFDRDFKLIGGEIPAGFLQRGL